VDAALALDASVTDRDPPFLYRYLGTKRAYLVADPVVNQTASHERKRAMKGDDYRKHRALVEIVVANLIHHYLTGSSGSGLPVPRSKKDKALGGRGNRYQSFVFPRTFPKTLDALCVLGFAEQTLGEYSALRDKSKRTTIRAGAKLIELVDQHGVTLDDLKQGDREEIIILKRPKRGHFDEGSRIDYEDNDTTRRYRDELRAINEWLASADICFDPTACDHPVDVKARRLHRNFTMGRFDRGGRLFGGFWEQLPKPVRLQGITIEGESVIGLDYSQLNPLLAYHLAGAVPPTGDAYTLPGLEKHREGVKKVFNAMLFTCPEKFPKGTRALFPRRVKCKDVIAAILERHPKLKGVLLSAGIGHQLQFLESEIMMRILRRCRERHIVALPVFDCVVVKASAENDVRVIMRREFAALTGFDVVVGREQLS
jgi:hypothetical protein